MAVSSVSPVVVVGTPLYSGDTAAVGELAEETPTEWTERAGEKDPGDGEVGVVSVSVNSSSLSAEGVRTGMNIRSQGSHVRYNSAVTLE